MKTTTQRFASVDAMRGVTVAAMLLVNNPGDWGHVYAPLLHADWHGCTLTDLIFPFFLFVVGVSIALGIVPRVQMGADLGKLHRGIVVRALKIVAIGMLLHVLAMWWLDRPDFRIWGVLQRIGVCFLFAALLAIHLKARMQWLLIAAILLGYWALLAWGGGYAPDVNLANRIDATLFGKHIYLYDPATGLGQEPEGLLSTLPAIATTLLGVRAGDWLRRGDTRAMWVSAIVFLALGWLWSPWFPINKPLWTSSYVLWTAGWALLALLVVHVLIDKRGWPAFGRSFGVNAITAYAGSAAMVYALLGTGIWQWLYNHAYASWMTPMFGPCVPSLAFALSYVVLWWGIVRWMDRRGWRVRV